MTVILEGVNNQCIVKNGVVFFPGFKLPVTADIRWKNSVNKKIIALQLLSFYAVEKVINGEAVLGG